MAGEEIAVGIWHWRGTPVAEIFGVKPTGREAENRVASIFKLRDGLLVDYTHISDGLSTALQMGATLTMGSVTAGAHLRRAERLSDCRASEACRATTD